MALDSREAEAFVELEAAYPEIKIGICMQNRVNNSVEELKEYIENRTYGAITGIRGSVMWYRPADYYQSKNWRGKWQGAGGGCLINQSIHTLDLMYYLGREVECVKASVSQILDYGIEVEDTVVANLKYSNGFRGLFFATNGNYKNEPIQISVSLEKAEFLICNNILYQVMDGENKKEVVQDFKRIGDKFYYGSSHKKLIDQFYKVLENEGGSYIKAGDAYMSIRLIDSIQNSGKFGIKVNV